MSQTTIVLMLAAFASLVDILLQAARERRKT
jgi:hypothetical protein